MERRQALATKDACETRQHGMQITAFTDNTWDDRVLPSPSPTETPTYMVPSSAAASSHSGQASPPDTGMDPYGDGTYELSTTTSASSSLMDSCSSAAMYDAEEPEQDAHGTDWDQSSDQGSVVPKLEPVEDELFLDGLNATPLTPNEAASSSEKQKRPRGRPRKHPVTPVTTGSKVAKGRSKTGCITCRKRKKKCDETKPRCMNCEKNAVVCEGYHEKQIWKSGKDRAEERMRQESAPSVALQPIFHAVETAEDKIFWRHYVNRLSNVLTVEGDQGNAYKDILLHLANQHESLMHSILAVSSAHLDLDSPEGSKVLQLNPTTTKESLQERSQHHQGEAFSRLYKDCSIGFDTDDPEHQTVLAARYGQILCQLLQTLVEGNQDGQHRMHLRVYQTLMHASPPQNEAFHAFITEFFQYHIFADDLLWHPDLASPRLVLVNTLETGMNVYPQRLLGVGDGLFRYMAEINTIRNSVRRNLAAGVDPAVNYNDLYEAARIDTDLRNWSPTWPQGDNRAQAASLYRMVLWVYLHRTIYPFVLGQQTRRPSETSPPIIQPTIINGIVAPEQQQPPTIQRRQSTAGIMPTHTIASPSSSSSNGPPTRSSSMHEQDTRRPPSPPPSRRPSQDSQRLIIMVAESLDKLDKFAEDDPVQTLLLIPCLILGTSCVEAAQHEKIRAAVRNVRGYTGLRTCDRVLELLEEIWNLMERQHWAAVWDWQGTARRMGLDFLCT